MPKRRKGVSYAKYGYIFSIPFVLIFLIFSLYPIIYTVMVSFSDLRGFGTELNFLEKPFDNFISVLNNQTFTKALANTALIWMLNFIPQMLVALVLAAWFTNKRTKIKGQGIFKILFYMPNIITAASIAILFGALFGQDGPVDYLLKSIGAVPKDVPLRLLSNGWVSRGIVAFIQFWTWYGYTMLILISGINGLNPETFESADIDGASPRQTFFHVVLPNLRTVMIYTLVTSLIGGLQMFDVPRVFQNGQPDGATMTASLFIYNQAFGTAHIMNMAAAASLLMFILIAVLSVGIFFILRDRDAIRERKQEKARLKEWKKAGGEAR